MLIFKNKWFANQGGIFKPFLEHRDRATGLANATMATYDAALELYGVKLK